MLLAWPELPEASANFGRTRGPSTARASASRKPTSLRMTGSGKETTENLGRWPTQARFWLELLPDAHINPGVIPKPALSPAGRGIWRGAPQPSLPRQVVRDPRNIPVRLLRAPPSVAQGKLPLAWKKRRVSG